MRYLQTCPHCHRQYDVSHLEVGSSVLCECGRDFAVAHHAPHDPRVLRCSGCGGNLQAQASRCEYCQAEITLDERRLDSVCPGCFARAASQARYCMECGVEFRPQALAALPEGTRCPRCQGALASRALGPTTVVECRGCGGLWLSESDFERVCDDADLQEQAARALGGPQAPGQVVPDVPVRYLPCPQCGERMWRKNYASCSGIILDVCRRHGVWLDHRELERVLEFIRAGGLDKARARELEQIQAQRAALEAERRQARNAWGDLGRQSPAAPFGGGFGGGDFAREFMGGFGRRFGRRPDLGSWVIERVLRGLFK